MYSTQDAAAPSVPVMVKEPVWSPGADNTFYWNPATDEGVGVGDYRVLVADSPSFATGTIVLDTTTTGTSIDVHNLIHGRTYYVKVQARDHFGYASAYSAYTFTTQDGLGPLAPGLKTLPMYSMEGPVTLSWEPADDGWGSGVAYYEVHWDNRSDWLGMYRVRSHITGHSISVTGLAANETWYFRIMACDGTGNMGDHAYTNTTIDGTPPTTPGIEVMDEYTAGTAVTVSWDASTDDLSGIDRYRVMVFAQQGTGLVRSEATDKTSQHFPGLASGREFWFQVIAVDNAGNSNASAYTSTIMDDTPPTRPMVGALPMFSKGTSLDVRWGPAIDAGIGGVEYMLEWAEDADFTVGKQDTPWQTEMTYTVTGLADGKMYHFHVKARDGLQNEGMWGPMTYTEMDDSAPGTPTMEPVDAHVPGPAVTVSWGAVSDGSGTPVEYQVRVYDTDAPGGGMIASFRWTREMMFVCVGLPSDTALFFQVVARDHMGWESTPSSFVQSYIDTEGPGEAVVDDLPEFTAGSGVTVTWSEAADGGIGMVEYRVVAYSNAGMTNRFYVTAWTPSTSADVYGLADGMQYWFVVETRDGFGNTGHTSSAVSTTMDASPPVVAVDKDLFGGSEDITGTCSDAVSGVGSVQVSTNGVDGWEEADMDGGTWSISLSAFPAETIEAVHARATDEVGNVQMDCAMAAVDTKDPVVTITSPTSGADVSGAVVISGTVSDANLRSYVVEYQPPGGSDWTTVQPEQVTSGESGVLATWLTAGLAGGGYTIRVMATDMVDNDREATVDVTLKGAALSISPSDISFSDTHPLPGDKVTVLVTVRNNGGSPAEDVTVTVLQEGTSVGEQSGVTVPAHGTATVAVQVEAKEGKREFTARASSTLYDTGTMSEGKPLNTIEAESTMENVAGVLALLALILALVAILLVFLMRGRGGGPEAAPPARDEDVIIDPVLEDDLTPEPEGPEPLPAPTPGEEPPQRPRTH